MEAFTKEYAEQYDAMVRFYRLIGVRDEHYRSQAVTSLCLKACDTVVDLACGTGLNFILLEKKIGPGGSIIGVDSSAAMLEEARKKIKAAGWKNIELVQSDMSAYNFPRQLDGILCTNSINLTADFDGVIRRAAEALKPDARLALLDVKRAERPPFWMDLYPAWKRHPFGYGGDLLSRRPWQSVPKYLTQVGYREFFWGYMYLCVGKSHHTNG